MNIQKPSRLDQAQDRLDRAIQRLEAAVETNLATRKDQADDPVMAGLETEVVQLRTDNENLKAVNDQMADRLDGAIAKLKLILES